MLNVYLDLGNVSALLALPGIKALIEREIVDIRFFPIKGIVPRPLSPEPTARPDDPLSEFKHLRWQAKSRFESEELARDCERLSLDVQTASRVFESSMVHAAWLHLINLDETQVLPFIEAVLDARFRQGLPVESKEDVRALLTNLGVEASDSAWFESAWDEHESAYLELGIHDSPAFVLSDETFQGRQHFPLIEWRLREARADSELGAPPV